MATPAAVRPATTLGDPTNPFARLGQALWRLATSVDVAVAQIIFLAILAAIGMTLQQLPDFAYRSPSDYATAIETIHARYDPVLGPGLVNVLERLGAFGVFKSGLFGVGLVVLVISIIVCTLDRTPKLWRDVSAVRVVQPEPFFDPRLPDRAAMSGVTAEAVAVAARRRGFHLREATSPDGTAYLYGDRHQYTKLATLLTHLGLVLFLVAAAVTSRFGDEQGLIVPEGSSLTVQNIATRAIAGLPIRFDVNIRAPFYSLIGNVRAMYDQSAIRDPRELGLLDAQGNVIRRETEGPPPEPVNPDDLIPDEAAIQRRESEEVP